MKIVKENEVEDFPDDFTIPCNTVSSVMRAQNNYDITKSHHEREFN